MVFSECKKHLSGFFLKKNKAGFYIISSVVLLAGVMVFRAGLQQTDTVQNPTDPRIIQAAGFEYFTQCVETSNIKPYGKGTGYSYSQNAQQLKANLNSLADWHCGLYAMYFGLNLPPQTGAVIYGINQPATGANHAVIQILDSNRIVTCDPTLGIIYNADLNNLIAGNVDYSKIAFYGKKVSRRFRNYHGEKFFKNARIVAKFDLSVLHKHSAASGMNIESSIYAKYLDLFALHKQCTVYHQYGI